MREVAQAAGVSIKTVSRVINNEPGVTGGVRDRVLAEADRLNYRHNLAASNLRRADSRTGVIGVLVQDVANSFSAGLVRAIEDALRPRGAMLFTASLDETSVREQRIVENLIARRVDGLVIAPASARQDYLAHEIASGLAVVFVDRRPHGVDADSVTVDNAHGARLGVAHLLAHGHRRIAVITDNPKIATSRERIAGARAAFGNAGVAFPEDLCVHARDAAAAAAQTERLLALPEPATAIFAARNVLAEGALRVLTARQLRGQVALVGFDDFPTADLLGLSVIRQDLGRLGALVAERLLARLDGDTSGARHQVLIPALVARGSGEVPFTAR